MAADSGMDTCPSPEIADSRKRPLDGDAENGDSKRSHFSSDGGSDEGIGMTDFVTILPEFVKYVADYKSDVTEVLESWLASQT